MRWYFIVHFLGSTGVRVSELIEIKAEHVAQGYMDLYSKGNKLRRVFFPETLCAEALAWLRGVGIESGYISVSYTHLIPFVDDYKLVFHGPTKLEVIVYEKDIVGYVSDMSSYMYFDRDGIVVESSSSKLEGVPWITGLHFGQLILHRPLPVEDQTVFQDILNLTQQLSLHQLSVDRIEYNSHKKATLYMGEMEVTLGDDTNIDSKISVLSDILAAQPQLVGIPGAVSYTHLDVYKRQRTTA